MGAPQGRLTDPAVVPSLAAGGAVQDPLSRIAELEKRQRRVDVQYGVAQALSRAPTPEEAFANALDVLGSGLGWPLCNLWRTDGPRGSPHWAATWIEPGLRQHAAPFAKLLRSVDLPNTPTSLVGRVRSTGKPAWIPDVSGDASFLGAAEAGAAGLRSALGFPILGNERVVAVMSAYAPAIEEPDPELVETLEGVLAELRTFIDRCRVNEALRLADAQRDAILDSVADGIVAFDPDGRFVYANSAAARVAGFSSAQEMLNADAAETRARFAVYDADGKLFDRAAFFRSARSGKSIPSLTVRYRVLATGEEHWQTSNLRPVFDDHGDVALVVSVAHDITALKRSEVAQRVLAGTGDLLATDLDFMERVRQVADLAVPLMADWCAVDILSEDGSVQFAGLAHANPSKVAMVRQWRARHPVDLDGPGGVAKVIRTGEPEFIAAISPELLADIEDPEALQLLDEIGPRSVIIVPLMARGRVYGAASFIWAESGRHYDSEDLAVALELGRRVGVAVDNARLYESMIAHNAELEARVVSRTALLEHANAQLRLESAERERAGEHFRVALESAPDGIVIADEHGVIMRVNTEAERLFGFGAQELVGRNVELLLPRRFHGGHRRHRAGYMADPHRRPMGVGLDLQARRKDGSEFPVEVSLSPLETDQGTWVMSAIRDVSARRQAARDMEELRGRLLEGREEERMLLAQNLHEGPVQTIFGLTYHLNEVLTASSDEERRERVLGVQSGLRDIAATLRAICADLQPPTLAVFGLEPAIRSRLAELEGEVPELAVRTELEPDQDRLPEPVRTALYRIFQEAIGNVRRHASATTATVRLSLDAETVTLEVDDDGVGFELPKRWVEMARTGHLGLAGAASRADAIGGRLYVVTSPGKGTQVRVVVPLAEPSHFVTGVD